MCLIQRVGRLSVEAADDYGELADNYLPTCTGRSALKSADSELESVDSIADSIANPPKIGGWVRAFRGGVRLNSQLQPKCYIIH